MSKSVESTKNMNISHVDCIIIGLVDVKRQ